MGSSVVVVSRRGGLVVPLGFSPVFVGRPGPLGSPFPLGRLSRGQSVAAFRRWLWFSVVCPGVVGGAEGEFVGGREREAWCALVGLVARVRAGERLALVCWCVPLACHGSVVRGAVLWLVRSGVV